MMKSILGNTYGRLEVIKEFSKNISTKTRANNKIQYCVCKCACNNIVEVRRSSLLGNNTYSCGCLKHELDVAKMVERNKDGHKLSKTKIYYLWLHMRQRCNSEYDSSYHNYGGRGIKVCEDWDRDFESFYSWAIENGYREDLDDKNRNKISIDRIDNERDYEPTNCRFVYSKEQARNKRSNIRLPYNGEIITLIELSEIKNIPYKTVRNRWNRGDRTIERLIRPLDVSRRNNKYKA